MLSVLRAIDTDIMQKIVLKEGSVLRLSTRADYISALLSFSSRHGLPYVIRASSFHALSNLA